jgi:hypothetical protein
VRSEAELSYHAYIQATVMLCWTMPVTPSNEMAMIGAVRAAMRIAIRHAKHAYVMFITLVVTAQQP